MLDFQYKEVKRKHGGSIVFCDLKDLICKSLGIDDPEDAPKTGSEYVIHCPFCAEEGHSKHKLYIKDDFSLGHCFVCGRAFVNVTDEINFEVRVSDSILNFGRTLEKLNLVPLTDPTWSLNKIESDFVDFDQTGYDYLCSRHPYMKDLYKILGFKFWEGNIVMPFYYHGTPFYYQIRFSNVGHDDKGIRYFFPPISAKPPYIIDHGQGKIRKLILCEGVFDAISLLIQAPDYIPVALLGSSISNYQINFIREYLPEHIIIFMDETEISLRIKDKLKSAIDYCPIDIIRSGGEDPEECMIRKMKQGKDQGWISEMIKNKKSRPAFRIPCPKFTIC